MCAAVEPFDFVAVEVLRVYAVQTLDVCVTLVLECRPVEWRRFFDGEAIGFGFVDGLRDGCCVPCYLLGNTCDEVSARPALL